MSLVVKRARRFAQAHLLEDEAAEHVPAVGAHSDGLTAHRAPRTARRRQDDDARGLPPHYRMQRRAGTWPRKWYN